ncbi:MAG TPA: PLP-dependent aminotransferase family protein [Firmicutes bacterium]|jgi:GntR family transcriptional regulator / MocR family aminotransferase|nr:PLP-dependent aminotransferase family protein [Bacillota bacterium]
MLHLDIQKEPGSPIMKQIYQQIRYKILNGEIKAGEKLSSSREMSQNLNVSRNTIMSAYEMLIAEGYLATIPGSGFFVAQGVEFPETPSGINDYQMTAFTARQLEEGTIGFHSGTPALDLFPRSKWNKIASQTFNEAPVSALGYDDPQGRPELRNILALYLKKVRGMHCHPDQIIITTGAKQGLSLVAKCLLKSGSEVWIEDPSNINVRKIFFYHTDHIVPIAVDYQGIRPELFPAGGSPELIFVTPSHQFPLGGVLPIQRRLALVRFAQKSDCYIVEDDYDSEFSYRGMPVTTLQELDNKKVIYIGTFSKILFPSLRLGYIVLPFPLIEPFREWKRLGDHHSNSLNQLTLMRFIESGELERHIARMKKIYHKRRDFLIAGLHEYFPDQVKIIGEMAGMHVVAEFLGVTFTAELIQELEKARVNVIPVEEHAMVKGNHQNQMILGYAHLDEAEIAEGLLRLERIIKPAFCSSDGKKNYRE